MIKITNIEKQAIRFCVILLLFCVFPWLSRARAQTLSLGLYPPLLEVMIKPGKTITQVFDISNFGEPMILTANILPFTPKDELGNVHLQEEITPVPPHLAWFSLANADLSLDDPFLLNPNQNQQVVLKIKVPKNADEGDYYLSLVFTSNITKGQETSTQSKAKIAAHILLTVSTTGLPEKSGKIIEFKVPKIVDSFDKIPITLKVKNTGSAFFKPQGQITLQAPFGLKTDFPIWAENVLADSTRLLHASSSASLASNLEPRASSLLLSGFFLGSYKISAKFSLDQTNVFLSQEEKFFAFPFKLILAFFIMITFLILIKKKVSP